MSQNIKIKPKFYYKNLLRVINLHCHEELCLSLPLKKNLKKTSLATKFNKNT